MRQPRAAVRAKYASAHAPWFGTEHADFPRTMWWDDLDASILAALADGGKSPRELGDKLGLSEQSMTSLVSMLAMQGRVRISQVEMITDV